MKLSILTPTIPERINQVTALQSRIKNQISKLGITGQVEHLVFSDNRARSIGAKRQALVDIARGEYIAFVDDDDDISDTYVERIMVAAKANPDVITFHQHATYNGLVSTVHFRLGQADGVFNPGGVTIRNAWHVCVWKRSIVEGCQFLENNYGEDLAWCIQARKRARTEIHVPQVLHYYRHDRNTTAAPENKHQKP